MLPRLWVVTAYHTAAVAAAAMARFDSRQDDTDDVDVCGLICSEEDDMYVFFSDPCSVKCNGFYECMSGVPYQLECPHGLLWNQDLQVCDWPQNVGDCSPVPECCAV
ncbi:hypothetical protein PG993_006554 [Apiospora rasikravindrae]|uniref:Chitin-binding type-2 domain-containing protein n=1 Tax=Apiospora rasikravindrae TaxID=990691 RepID=A0ABR1T613_9PEZI